MKVSVICPTYQRFERHPYLYETFNRQTYADKELLIMDDSTEKSPFFSNLKDDRVAYFFLSSHCTTGHKRNLLIDLSQGEIIVHFDDDDFYASTYIQTMVDLIQEADFVKPSKWLAWQEGGGHLWEWDIHYKTNMFINIAGNGEIRKFINLPEEYMEAINKLTRTNLGFFGFSHVYRKSLWEAHPFEDRTLAEDVAFVKQAIKSGKVCKHVVTPSYLILHTLHIQSTSRVQPQRLLPSSKAIELWGEEVRPWLIVA